MSIAPPAARTRFFAMFALVFAGEMIFSLPFHVPRYFRPSVLEAFAFNNATLGDIFAVYGVTAMLAYFPGGALADHLPARALMIASLLGTAAGGCYLATLPGAGGMAVLYGYWGVTTILLFWAAMIRATRAWGGSAAQGRAFGILDGGRGLAAAACASLAVLAFSAVAGNAHDGQLDATTRREALRSVILLYSAATAAAALLVWRWIPDRDDSVDSPRFALAVLGRVIGRRVVWLQAVVVVCAYCGYKGLDNYALYAHEVLGWTETRAAGLSAAGAWLRPLSALAAGIIADRAGIARSIGLLFAALAAVYGVLATLGSDTGAVAFIYANLAVSFCAVFALRGIYFALLAESRVAFADTGTAVGLVSLIGYTPDVFFAALAGRLLDATPGAGGHQHYFILLAGIAIIGLIATSLLMRAQRQARTL